MAVSIKSVYGKVILICKISSGCLQYFLREYCNEHAQKNTLNTALDRQEIWRLYQTRQWRVTDLALRYRVSRPTIYKVLKHARLQSFSPKKSTNTRYRTIQYGIKRLGKIKQSIQHRLKQKAKRYNKSYPGELMHFDTKRLPLLQGQKATEARDYLFVAIDDYSRELYADILPDKTQHSAKAFLLDNVLTQCPYTIDYIYSDNGKEYKGTPQHAFASTCCDKCIGKIYAYRQTTDQR